MTPSQKDDQRVPTHTPTIDDRLTAALEAARLVGAILLEGLGRPHDVRSKSDDTDLLTEIDLKAEAAVLDYLQSRFPDDAILAEEGGARPGETGTWFIDPLDGTTNFAHAIPFFSVSLAYADDAGVRLGVVFDPVRDELFQGVRGLGAEVNGKALQVSRTANLNRSLLTTGFPYDMRTAQTTNLDHYADLAMLTQGVRRLGAASLDLAYVAAGRFDGYWELRTYPWDASAGMLLVTEAGGMISSTLGPQAPQFEGMSPSSVLATNGHIHEAMLAVLARRAAGQT
jgi:myo-inositol-1(or 4)-monophosphatase